MQLNTVHFSDIKTHIIKHLNGAEKSIKLAVSWLTDKELFNILLTKLDEGISVNLITRNDYLNNHPEALPWDDFIKAGGILKFSRNGEQLHYKFILVDDKGVLCTSYNLTCFANGNNRENVMLFSDAGFVSQFIAEFDYLTSTLPSETSVKRIQLEDVPVELHGFYNTTLVSDKAKQKA
ncbi:MAG: phospholipase D-like domain-containing protein [Bacteroidetes bacterium]|nr:phospholipase D-like domain-containing protein [Bacteroidota bacterium]